MATGGPYDFFIRLWNPETGLEVAAFPGQVYDHGCGLAFSPDGKKIAYGHGGGVGLVDLETKKKLADFPGYRVYNLAFSPNGKMLAIGSAGNASLWDLSNTKKALATFDKTGHAAVTFSPDSKTLAIRGDEKTVKLWDIAGAREMTTIPNNPNYSGQILFSPDGGTLAIPQLNSTVLLWDVAGDKERLVLKGGNPTRIAFSPDGQTLAGGGYGGLVTFWETATGKVKFQAHPTHVGAVAFSPDGKTLATGDGGGALRFWDAATGKEKNPLTGYSQPVGGVWVTPDGKSIISCDGRPGWPPQSFTLKEWNLANEKKVVPHKGNGWGFGGRGGILAPDGKTFAEVGEGGIHLRDLGTGKKINRIKISQGEDADVIAFSPHGNLFAIGGRNKTLAVRNTNNNLEEPRNFSAPADVLCLAFAPDNKTLISGGADGVIHIWDVSTGQKKMSLPSQGQGIVSLAVAPDGKSFATGTESVGLKLWNLQTGKELASFPGHHSRINSLVFSPDSKRLFSAGMDGRVIKWVSPLDKHEWKFPGGVNSLALSADGRHLITANGNGTIYVLRLAAAQ